MLTEAELVAAYEAMAADEEQEREVLEWIEADLGDCFDDDGLEPA